MRPINKIVISYLKPRLKAIDSYQSTPFSVQQRVFRELVAHGRDSLFGKEHTMGNVSDYESFRRMIPVRDYNALEPYFNRIRNGENYILWDEKVRWMAKSSGTSSARSKFIPITPSNLHKCHYRGFQTLLASYVNSHPDTCMFNGKSLTLGGSTSLDKLSNNRIYSGDLSGILMQNSPFVTELLRTPSRDIAMLSDFDEKINKICRYCSKEDVTTISGVPSWYLVLLKRVLEYTGATDITHVWPNMELFMHGGISFAPYKEQFRRLIPSEKMNYVENYNASEGYFAFRHAPSDKGMLLTLDNGVFYEFVPIEYLDRVLEGDSSYCCTLEGVRKGVRYAIIITTNSGLWRYLVGDCVEFTSIAPYQIIICGRTQLYINTFGEELMIHNAEEALSSVCNDFSVHVTDYTVAPKFDQEGTGGCHQWCIEFAPESQEITSRPDFRNTFEKALDDKVRDLNSDYDGKRTNNVAMQQLQIEIMPEGSFMKWMKSRGKMGGQNKVPRLSNERKIIEDILKYKEQL